MWLARAIILCGRCSCKLRDKDSQLVAKTYDLKSAYRQVPIHEDHLKFSFFSIYNCEQDCAEVYQLVVCTAF
jgi:hypothetical protein